jgi:hypothetical protein
MKLKHVGPVSSPLYIDSSLFIHPVSKTLVECQSMCDANANPIGGGQ